MSARAIEAEVSIKSGVSAECTIGREVIVEVHDDITLDSLTVTANGQYEPAEGVDGFSEVSVNVPSTIPDIEPLMVTEDGTYTASGDGYNPVKVNTGVAALASEISAAKAASGCDPLTTGITALTTYANEVTGGADITLSDAVGTLIAGYGGGLPMGIKAITSGVVTIESQVANIIITTNLGYTPDFFLIRIDADDWNKIPFSAAVEQAYIRNEYANMPNYLNGRYFWLYCYKHSTSGNNLSGQYSSALSIATENTFTVQKGGANWHPNDTDGNPIKYRWIAIKVDE